jgi:sortase family protein
MIRSIVRVVSAVLVLTGLVVLTLVGATYFQQTQAEKQAEARVPGQGTQPALVLLPTLAPDSPTPTEAPTDTAAPVVTPTTQQTEPPTATPTRQMIVDANGLPVGLGADPARLVVPRMRLDTKVEEATWDVVNQNNQQVSEWQIPFNAAGHLKTTPKPGEAGNAVMSGHNNLTAPNTFGVGLFAGLWNLQVGDPVYITDSFGRAFLFRVSKFYYVQELGVPDAVREQHYQDMLADDGTPIITLETCWNGYQAPLSGNTYRWIVRARLVGSVDGNRITSVNG